MKQIILLLALFLKLSNMNAGGCNPWFNISNPNPANHNVGGLHDTILVTLNPLDSNLIFDLYNSGAGCSTGNPY